ncbi:Nif11-like leader peptide family natural product precursor [Bacillus solimangrovi]|uniref:Nif11 domain-containing protein n=1 Tax=Bacillus solimangrovi TaxID=1305675 RepID=A0A1E5LE72_9BACI|nr:Nif11-like leader peptide family natural product precursor [Bacillus solimangrovi]OEH92387.1 hypothetical protein BFG57_16225 [Bacillus solimangrovi]
MALVHLVRFLEFAEQDESLMKHLAKGATAEEIASLAAKLGFEFSAIEWTSLEEDTSRRNFDYEELERLLGKMGHQV